MKNEFNNYFKPNDLKFNSKEEVVLSEAKESVDTRMIEASFDTSVTNDGSRI